ncbi:TetR/AcrR family transcriptional regulator [Stackebrandtia nassauensis]|uniref:Transcriptional regulator, TetR family n=1 Tax=Stackebrandtia nassauensis (strain DSM 44728 / CIP 108903 / NRRL B-16338 / NBRC 102104 / LLR-40K-21) TaxID=446470 RepID=D3Q7R3_STANL|nr:TetR/AcrR family transcriptional regulator [Stackebrandtia nassauensis]ADD44405.1 transcriptional regulator, TetR family [Stackebrandtia nassauensis DSM 44728]
MEPTPAAIRAAQRGTTKRTPRVELSLDRIVTAAIHLADRDGLPGISMAKVAKELGFATMSLYRHLDSKEELLLHAQDSAIGPPPANIATAPDWRTCLTRWTRELVTAYRRHPWAAEIPVTGPPLLPRSLEWLNAGLTTLRTLPLQPLEKLSTMSLLGGYARTEVTLRAIIDKEAALDPNARPDLEYESQLRTLTAHRDLPALTEMLATGDIFTLPSDTPTDDGDDFMVDFGLERILDGIQALITRREGSRRK